MMWTDRQSPDANPTQPVCTGNAKKTFVNALWIALLIGLHACAFFYFVPAHIAIHRQHRQLSPILVVNILLGWTIIGWVVALAWSLSTDVGDNAK